MPAQWCGIRTRRAKARTIRVRTVVRRLEGRQWVPPGLLFWKLAPEDLEAWEARFGGSSETA